MKILYVGGVYPVELSLFKEGQGNPNITVRFCNDGASIPDAFNMCGCKRVVDRAGIDNIKSSFQPDLTIFRTWCPTEAFIQAGEVLWAQEIFPTLDNDVPTGNNNVPNRNGCSVAYQSKPRAEKAGGYWLPYCVSKHWGKVPTEKSIPVMVATSIPEMATDAKLRSMDILVRPLVANMPANVFAFSGYHGGLEKMDYVRPCLKPSFSPLQAVYHISKAKIYVSPTTIWHDEGCVSYKTVESMACGVLTLTNNYVGMEDVFGKDGENLLYSNSPEETLSKVQYYLTHDKEREEIALRGYNFIHSEYGWEKNLTRLKKELGL